MQKITWKPDEAARKAGINFDQLTGGDITMSNGIKIVRFREQMIKVGGKMVVCCIRVDTRPDLAAYVADLEAADQKERAEKAEVAKRTVKIYLSSRGWGDYSSCEWVGDITRPDSEILTECKRLLTTEHDVDQPNQPGDELMGKIVAARAKWEGAPARKAAMEASEAEDIRRKIANGYCFSCGSYCHGDCGNYSNNPMIETRRNFAKGQREANYGIND